MIWEFVVGHTFAQHASLLGVDWLIFACFQFSPYHFVGFLQSERVTWPFM